MTQFIYRLFCRMGPKCWIRYNYKRLVINVLYTLMYLCVIQPGWSWSRGTREHGKSIMVVYLPTSPDVSKFYLDLNLEPFPRYETG